jgi:tRNA pseudouridine38-40 synthase
MRFRLLIEYNGSAYNGWQIQNGQVTIQGEIEQALRQVFSEQIGVVGAGRTDTGVHARGQVAHFDIGLQPDPGKLLRSLNGILKKEIRIKDISSVGSNFHARYSAKLREYHYCIATQPTALLTDYSWYLTYDLDLKQMNKAVKYINGRHDFESFCRSKSDVTNHFCHIKKAQWSKKDNLLLFTIQADRFLHGMVRTLVGTFVDIGRSKLNVTDIREIMKGKNRSLASQSAPAKGLILEKVYY